MNQIVLAIYNAQNKFDSMLRDRKGATSVEYAAMLGLILLAVTAGFKALGNKINAELQEAGSAVAGLVNGGAR